MNYSNDASLKATFGDSEVTGLVTDSPGVTSPARLEKAASTAMDEINNYLRSAGYLLPLVFTEYGATITPPAVAIPLPAQLQMASDAFTAFHLASTMDLNKKKYEDLRAQYLAWLEDVRMSKIRLDLPLTTDITGSGKVVTIARPQVFDKYLRRESDVFGIN